MEPLISLTFSLPASQAEKVIAYVNSLGSPAVPSGVHSDPKRSSPGSVFELRDQHDLRDLLDERLREVVRFIVKSRGRFYNDELASILGVDDPLTSNALGHLTRKLRKVGVEAEGFRGTNWYRTVRRSGRTLIIVRADVLDIFTKTLEGK